MNTQFTINNITQDINTSSIPIIYTHLDTITIFFLSFGCFFCLLSSRLIYKRLLHNKEIGNNMNNSNCSENSCSENIDYNKLSDIYNMVKNNEIKYIEL